MEKEKEHLRGLGELEHPECLLLVALLGLAGLVGGGFLLGIPVSAAPFWISFGSVPLVLALLRRWRSAAVFVVLAGLAWLMTAYSFGYFGWDACSCHFPMSDAMRQGWNPVREVTTKELGAYYAGHNVKLLHVLYDPKFHALVGASVSASTGLFSALPFSGYVVMLVLVMTAYRFVRNALGGGKCLSCACAVLAICYGKRFLEHSQGCSDYLLYVSGLCSALSLLTWSHTSSRRDLFVCLGTAVILPLARFNGIGVSLAILVFLGFISWRKRVFWVGLACCVAFFVLVGYAPYFTNPWPLPNLTSDFSRNADGARMGWLARVVYFWISKGVALCACKITTGLDLHPIFRANSFPCLDGHGEWFRTCMLVSMPLAFMSRGWRVQLLALTLFCASVAVPVKYLGYERYFPLVYSVPFLVVLNFGCRPRWVGRRGTQVVRTCVTAFAVATSVWVAFRTCMTVDYLLTLESLRQQRLASLKDESACRSKVRSTQGRDSGYTLLRRAEIAGLRVTGERSFPKLLFGAPWRLIPQGNEREGWNRGNPAYRAWRTAKDIPWRKGNLLDYRWGGYGFPSPLFYP